MKGLTVLPMLAAALACAEVSPVAPVPTISTPGLASRSSSAADGMVPFGWSGWAITTSLANGCEGDASNIVGSAAGVFQTTHLGRSSVTYVNCFTSAFSWITQRGTMTAANGDKMFWYGSTADGSALVLDFATLTYSGTNFRIVGGTGRFEGAFGRLDYKGEFAADLSFSTGTGSGFISSVGLTKP